MLNDNGSESYGTIPEIENINSLQMSILNRLWLNERKRKEKKKRLFSLVETNINGARKYIDELLSQIEYDPSNYTLGSHNHKVLKSWLETFPFEDIWF